MPRFLFLIAVFFLPALTRVIAGTADDDWARIVALDAGPQTPMQDARAAAVAHLDKQEQALRSFVAEHATDGHGFEARLRLARLLQIRGDVQGSGKPVEEAARILDSLEKSATPEQRVEVDFARVTLLMRTLRPDSVMQRDRLLAASREFQRQHPDDRRVAPLLAEVASLFSLQPKTMRELLADAQMLATEAELKGRISDDLKRLDLLGRPVPLRYVGTDGKPFDLEQARGSVVALVFFAIWSPPSLAALDAMKRAVATLPKQTVQLIGISLDTKPEPLAAMLREKGIAEPVGYDGKGWESPLIRALGINTIPTVWLLDRRGRLRSLDGAQETASQLRQLAGER